MITPSEIRTKTSEPYEGPFESNAQYVSVRGWVQQEVMQLITEGSWLNILKKAAYGESESEDLLEKLVATFSLDNQIRPNTQALLNLLNLKAAEFAKQLATDIRNNPENAEILAALNAMEKAHAPLAPEEPALEL